MEEVLLTRLSAIWRVVDVNRSVVLHLVHATYAFACSTRANLNRAVDDWLGRRAAYVEDVPTYANAMVPAADGDYSFHPTEVGLMGHGLAPMVFAIDYSKRVVA